MGPGFPLAPQPLVAFMQALFPKLEAYVSVRRLAYELLQLSLFSLSKLVGIHRDLSEVLAWFSQSFSKASLLILFLVNWREGGHRLHRREVVFHPPFQVRKLCNFPSPDCVDNKQSPSPYSDLSQGIQQRMTLQVLPSQNLHDF